MPKTGKSLEKLVSSLEKALGDSGNVVVESPKRLTDKITGKLREHDVVLTINQAHHQVIVAIECRDRSRPITVNQVEGFWKKCQDTGVDHGVIVSSMGFYNTARQKSDFLGIRCLDIEEVESFDWMLAQGMHSLTKRLLHHDWVFYPKKEGIADKTNMEVMDVEGNLLTQEVLTSNALSQLTKLLSEPLAPVEKDSVTVKFPGDNLIIRNTETGETSPVKYVMATLHYSIVDEFIPFKLIQYKDADENITEAAVADFNAGNITGKFMIVGKFDEEKKVVFVPDKAKNT
ncbi:restriction endonuclease [Methylotuvimicrobium sp. KM2]|uniref:restriction endonuclease n=1 Tax=Methylotuvimicrobium sp. KM2 TaxID=3133976 RepID=UPI003100D6B9